MRPMEACGLQLHGKGYAALAATRAIKCAARRWMNLCRDAGSRAGVEASTAFFSALVCGKYLVRRGLDRSARVTRGADPTAFAGGY